MTVPRIESLGAYIPETALTTQELMASMTYPQPIDLEEITGIQERRLLQADESSFSAAVAAVNDCLQRSHYGADEIDIIISCSISRSMQSNQRNFFDPSLSLMIKKELGLTNAINFDVSNACAGMMSGVHILTELIKASIVKRGLVVSGEQISSIAMTAANEIEAPWDPQFGSLTVGDSGACVLIDGCGTATDHIDYIELTTCAEYAELCIGKPSSKTAGYALYTDNPEMHKRDRLLTWPRFHTQYLEQIGRQFVDEQFDFVIHHQVSARFVETVNRIGEMVFGTPMPPSLNCSAELGNTATTSHFLALYRALQTKKLPPKSKILFVPAASGIVTGCFSATITDLEVS